jgi:uncharacterized protein (TIGR01777 family)
VKIALSGSTGLIGRALAEALEVDGHTVVPMVRRMSAKTAGVYWNVKTMEIDSGRLEGIDAVVHLAGESIAAGRWTPEIKAQIRDSRVDGTGLIAEALADLTSPPKVFVVASAIGYYGDRGDEILTEQEPAGSGFLPDVTAAWEAAARPAKERGIRTAHMRIGIVLASEGGALGKMIKPFKLGMGGKLGSGKQYMSWISLRDVVAAIQFILANDHLSGPVNTVSPEPVTNAEFTSALANSLSRPAIASIPAFALKMMAGEMAEELLLASIRVVPARLTEAGFQFSDTRLEDTLKNLLAQDN